MPRPLILEMLRIDSLGLLVACGVQALIILGLALRIPYVRGQARRDGQAHARPDLEVRAAFYQGCWQARGEKINELSTDLAHTKAELAQLKGAVSNTWRVAGGPTKEQANFVLLNPRKRVR